MKCRVVSRPKAGFSCHWDSTPLSTGFCWGQSCSHPAGRRRDMFVIFSCTDTTTGLPRFGQTEQTSRKSEAQQHVLNHSLQWRSCPSSFWGFSPRHRKLRCMPNPTHTACLFSCAWIVTIKFHFYISHSEKLTITKRTTVKNIV